LLNHETTKKQAVLNQLIAIISFSAGAGYDAVLKPAVQDQEDVSRTLDAQPRNLGGKEGSGQPNQKDLNLQK